MDVGIAASPNVALIYKQQQLPHQPTPIMADATPILPTTRRALALRCSRIHIEWNTKVHNNLDGEFWLGGTSYLLLRDSAAAEFAYGLAYPSIHSVSTTLAYMYWYSYSIRLLTPQYHYQQANITTLKHCFIRGFSEPSHISLRQVLSFATIPLRAYVDRLTQ